MAFFSIPLYIISMWELFIYREVIRASHESVYEVWYYREYNLMGKQKNNNNKLGRTRRVVH